MQVSIAYVNPPKEGKTNGSLRLTDNSWITVPPNLLPLFANAKGTTCEIETREWKSPSGNTVIIAESGPGGVRAPAPPRAQPYAPPAAGQGGPVQSAPLALQPDRRLVELEKFFEMYVTGSVGRHLGSGKAASEHDVIATEAVRIFEQVVAPAFLRLSNLLSAPKVPTMPKLVTGTDNKWTSPNSEPGDPGPVELQ